MAKMAQYKIKLLDEFERRVDEWTYVDFEKRLQELKQGSSYHDAKGIINEAYRQGKWPKTVKRYLLTNFKTYGNVSGEFNTTFDQISKSLSAQERKLWGLD